MPCRRRCRGLQWALACAGLLLAACGAPDTSEAEASNASSPGATAAAAGDASSSASQATSTATSVPPSAAGSAQATRYVSDSAGWSVAVPDGWELVARDDQAAITLTRDGAIGEVYSSPSRGLGLEELLARTRQDLSTWEGAGAVEAEVVRLPAGEAVRATMETTSTEIGPGTFTAYVIDDGDRSYVVSVRGPGSGADLLAVAEELAESLAIDAP